MAAKVAGFIKLAIEAGKASPAPPIGPAKGGALASVGVAAPSLVPSAAIADAAERPSLRSCACKGLGMGLGWLGLGLALGWLGLGMGLGW